MNGSRVSITFDRVDSIMPTAAKSDFCMAKNASAKHSILQVLNAAAHSVEAAFSRARNRAEIIRSAAVRHKVFIADGID